ncbi:winged helix-turn-helix domain-containing protein [Devosia submarina]|uniref:winged helix-turn-helix domain-containing protein n=1 Tax=Devosia submarina TaxID=1173082 RepID=UPI000D347DD4|nr:winged helix DNA-binding domain-containing protein [Devosia submarina]
MPKATFSVSQTRACYLWIAAQKLDATEPFGAGPQATQQAIEQLGYVQIDTINVIERCHHHILQTRIPQYRRSDLTQLQSADKSIFEYWTHALSYVPISALPFFLPAMKGHRVGTSRWFGSVTSEEIKAMLGRLRTEGPLSIRDIADDELVSKNHPWASRKPSKRVLEAMFFQGLVAISVRQGMVKTYDLFARHFGWSAPPKPATARQTTAYLLDRALRSQALVSLDSICHLNAPAKKAVRELIDSRVRRKLLLPVRIEGSAVEHWAEPQTLEQLIEPPSLVHILSPFDPLVIQRKRLKLFFDYEHVFEAYVPAAKRRFGYFALPVLVGDRIVAAIDFKTDRVAGKLLIQNWTDIAPMGAEEKTAIDLALERFERFQLGD